MARYEFSDGKSQKFWEIELEGNTFTVRYGRMGTDGQTSTKVFESPEQALKEHDKLVKSKVKKGYAPVADVEREPEPGRNPDLESQILEHPDDEAAWRVYGDWLQSHGDPRGELLMAYATDADPRPLHEAHVKDFMGRFATEFAPYVQITWHMGFWKTLKVACDWESAEEMPDSISGLASIIGYALRHPSARFLQRLGLGVNETVVDGEVDFSGSVEAIVKNGIRPSIRELVVGDYERVDDTEISWTDVGSLKGLWTILPNLEQLTVQGGGIALGTISAPNLKQLRLWTGGLPKEPMEQIGKASLPALEELEIWFGADEYGAECDVSSLAGLLTGRGVPALKKLGLMNSEFANELPSALAKSALLPQLTELDLSMGTMTETGAQALARHADAFKHLTSIHLSENFISDAALTALRAALPQVTSSEQKGDEEEDWLYVSVGE